MVKTQSCSHSLLQKRKIDNQITIRCDGCREMVYDSLYYTCYPKCHYDLHEACYKAKETISHPSYKQGPFVLVKTPLPPNKELANICNSCETSVKGWRYVLTNIESGDKIFYHPRCMLLSQHSHEGHTASSSTREHGCGYGCGCDRGKRYQESSTARKLNIFYTGLKVTLTILEKFGALESIRHHVEDLMEEMLPEF